MHARGRAAPRGRARAPHAPRPHRARPRARGGSAGGVADGRRARLGPRADSREADTWRARVAAARAGEAERTTSGRSPRTRDARRAPRRGGAAMTELVLGLDQGTSSTRCVVLDGDLRELGSASVAVASSFPGPGSWNRTRRRSPSRRARDRRRAVQRRRRSARRRGARHRQPDGDVRGLGAATGRPIHPAIVWQDRRTDEACAELRAGGHEELVRERTGLELDATFPATKLRWVLDHVDGARAAAEDGRLAMATSRPGSCTAWRRPRHRRRQRGPLAALPARRTGLGRRAARALRGAPSAAAAGRGLGPDRRAGIGRGGGPGTGRGGRPAGLAVRAALLETRGREGDARDGRLRPRPGGRRAPRPPAGILASCAWRREIDQLRARGLHPDGRRSGRLVRADRRAAGGAGARRVLSSALRAIPASSAFRHCRASGARRGTRARAGRCSG